MSVAGVMRTRAVDQMRRRRSTAFVMAFFWAVAAAMFALALRRAEGTSESLPAIWSMCTAPLLPFVAAFLGMDLVSSERSSGRIDMLLSTVAETRDFVAGRFAALLFMLAEWTLALAVFEFVLVRFMAPAALVPFTAASFLPALVVLSFQAALWAAVTVAAGAFSRHAALSCIASVAVSCAIPRLGWMALSEFLPFGRVTLGQFPLDAHVSDMASGFVSVPTLAAYALAALWALYVASCKLSSLRYVGAGGRSRRAGAAAAMFSSCLFLASSLVLLSRFDLAFEVHSQDAALDFSERTQNILSETRGVVSATCFMSRKDPRFRQAARFMRVVKRRSEALGGAKFEIFYVDPAWDIPAAGRLVREGAKAPSLVFECGHRRSSVAIDGDVDERRVASAIRRLTAPAGRRMVYWTRGHGETSFDDYGPYGMSDIARELMRDGYENAELDLAGEKSIPAGCAFIVVAGAKNGFSRQETEKVDAYLRDGGRLLVLAGQEENGGVAALLPRWGMRLGEIRPSGERTLAGGDVIVSEFGSHPVSEMLAGSQAVFGNPVQFMPSAAAAAGTVLADRVDFSPLAIAGGAVLAAVSERGAAGAGLSLRPTRIVAVGDAGFVVNSQLKSRANANADLFMNAVAYLAGSGTFYGSGAVAGTLSTGMDLAASQRFFVISVVVAPGLLLVAMLAMCGWRRRKA